MKRDAGRRPGMDLVQRLRQRARRDAGPGPAGSARVPADVQLLVDEARIGCTSGMLLCLDREQRLVYILGEIFGVHGRASAPSCSRSRRDNFRQKLSRARRDLHSFMQGQCGLVNSANPCRCAKKTQGFIKAGYRRSAEPAVRPRARDSRARGRRQAPSRGSSRSMSRTRRSTASTHSTRAPDFVAAVRKLIDRPECRSHR